MVNKVKLFTVNAVKVFTTAAVKVLVSTVVRMVAVTAVNNFTFYCYRGKDFLLDHSTWNRGDKDAF